MIQLRRVLACDGIGCGGISLTVLATVDADSPDWQGWVPVRDDVAPSTTEPVKHLCPECVAAGNICE